MSIFALGTFTGSGLGPGLMGLVEQHLGWRWISWIQVSYPFDYQRSGVS
jgi:MFS family permease